MTQATRQAPAKRLRRSTASGYARGDETRQRIIDAAARLFGEHGFEGASTREIATAAGVNAPALQYYFENKEGLYKACAEYITDNLRDHYAPAMKQAKDVLKSDSGVDTLIDAYICIQTKTLDSVLAQPQPHKGLIGRELAGDSPNIASDMLRRKLKLPINKLLLSLLARITHAQPEDDVTRIRMLTLKGLVLAFYYPPGACLDLLRWKDIDAAKTAMIKAAVEEQTRTLLLSWHGKAVS